MEWQPDEADAWQSGRFPVSAGKPVWILPYDRQSEIPVEQQPDAADVRQSGRFPVSAGKPVWILPYDRQPEIQVERQSDAADVWQSKVICTRRYSTDGMVG